MQVNNNVTAFSAWKHYSASACEYGQNLRRLSSGDRIQSAGDAPADLALSERLRAQIRNAAAAASNVENKINYLQTADAWLQKIHDMLGRMAELSVMANDGTKSQVDRDNLQKEFEQMQKEITRITSGATASGKFNSLYLFRGGNGVASMREDGVYAGAAREDVQAIFQNVETQGQASIYPESSGADITAARWTITYTGSAWQLRSEPPGLDDRTIAAACDSSMIIPFVEGGNGFQVQIDAPANGTVYTEGDFFTVENTPGNAGNIVFHDTRAQIGSGTAVMRSTTNTLTESTIRGIYNEGAQRWVLYGMRTSQLIGTIHGAPNEGGSVQDIAGFDLTIDPPASSCYSTGDVMIWNLSDATDGLYLQRGPDSNQVFTEQSVNLQADNFEVIGSYTNYSYGSINMTLLGSQLGPQAVHWASLIRGSELNIAKQSSAQAAVARVNIGIDFISSKRAVLGAEMKRMEQVLSGLRSYEENARSTESRIRDLDVALETADVSKNKVLMEIGGAMLAQANSLPQSVLNLLGGNG